MRVIKNVRLPHGLASIFLKCFLFRFVFLRLSLTAYFSIDRGQYESSAIRLGERADSFYEYELFVNSTLREVHQAHILYQKAIPSNGTPSQTYFRSFLIEYTE